MHIITAKRIAEFEALFTDMMEMMGATETFSMVVLNGVYYAIHRKRLEGVLDRYSCYQSKQELYNQAYFVFRQADDNTLFMLKSRLPWTVVEARLLRYRFKMVQEDEMSA